MKRIVVTEFMDEAAVAELAATHEVHYDPQLVDATEQLRAAIAGADALIVRNRTRVDAALLACAPRLRVVGRLGVGLDNVEVEACHGRGIAVLPATGANGDAVAEYVIATAMMLLRGLHASTGEVAAGVWPRARMSQGRELAGKTFGLVGFGDIARRVARLARAFGVRVLACDPNVDLRSPSWSECNTRPATLEALLHEADVVSVHVPLAGDTRGLIDAARLARMKPDAILIDTARGGIVDEGALAEALRAGRLGGAALDVFASEPLPAESPLAGCPNLVLTPHIAGVTVEANQRVSFLIAEKVAAALASATDTVHAAP